MQTRLGRAEGFGTGSRQPTNGSNLDGITAPLLRCQRQLLRYANKQRADQFAIFTDKRCVIGLVVLAKDGRWPGEGAFVDQGFVSRAAMVKFGIGGGLPFVHQGRVGSNKVLTVKRKDRRFEFGLRP
jgi:hypothetical protein